MSEGRTAHRTAYKVVKIKIAEGENGPYLPQSEIRSTLDNKNRGEC